MSGRTASGSVLTLARAIFRKQLTLMFRYPINLVSGLLTLYLFFAMIFFGGRAVAGQALAGNLEGIIVGFFLWSMAWSAFADLTWNVTREAQWGTLEQLYMTPFGFEVVMLVTSLVNVALSFLTGAVILGLMLLTTGESLVVDLVTVVPLVVLGLLSVVGLGFVFGGLAIVYKRVENAFQILTFGFVGLVGAPVASVPALKLLPLSQSSYLLRQAMEDGVRLWEFAPIELAALVGVAAAYLVAGVAFFRVAQGRARKLGVLGHY
jgi:ABC-2 type transport system permease protein